jgi:hypothetical protein
MRCLSKHTTRPGEHGRINGLTPSEMFLRLIKSDTYAKKRSRKV